MPVMFRSSVCLFALLALTASHTVPGVVGAIQEEWDGDGSFFDLDDDVDEVDVDLDTEKSVPQVDPKVVAEPQTDSIGQRIDTYIAGNRVMIFSKSYCPYCN